MGFTTSVKANSSTAVASLALPSFNTTAGQTIAVVIALGSITSSISSIVDTKGNVYVLKSSSNASGVRAEVWTSLSIGAQVANIVTINITGGNTSIAAIAGEYSTITNIGNAGLTESGNSRAPISYVLTGFLNSWVVVGLAFACQSGDTFTSVLGTQRNTTIPAATAVGVALIDNTDAAQAYLPGHSLLNAARDWASVGVELETTSTPAVVETAEPIAATGVRAIGVTIPTAATIIESSTIMV